MIYKIIKDWKKIMNNKQQYIEYANKTFKGKALELVLKNIELFYDPTPIECPKKYKINDKVILKKETFLHGIPGKLENLDWIFENGFLASDFTEKSEGKNKIKNSIGMWKIKEEQTLEDYIVSYSGFTITYSIGRGPEAQNVSKLIPFHKFDEFTEKLNNDPEVWTYWGEKTKEVTFLPSLVSNKRQIAFIWKVTMQNKWLKQTFGIQI